MAVGVPQHCLPGLESLLWRWEGREFPSSPLAPSWVFLRYLPLGGQFRGVLLAMGGAVRPELRYGSACREQRLNAVSVYLVYIEFIYNSARMCGDE